MAREIKQKVPAFVAVDNVTRNSTYIPVTALQSTNSTETLLSCADYSNVTPGVAQLSSIYDTSTTSDPGYIAINATGGTNSYYTYSPWVLVEAQKAPGQKEKLEQSRSAMRKFASRGWTPYEKIPSKYPSSKARIWMSTDVSHFGEFHLFLDPTYRKDVCYSFSETSDALKHRHRCIKTTNSIFLSTSLFDLGYRVFIHTTIRGAMGNGCIELRPNDAENKQMLRAMFESPEYKDLHTVGSHFVKKVSDDDDLRTLLLAGELTDVKKLLRIEKHSADPAFSDKDD